MLKIGSNTLINNLVLAPMAGYTCPAFRKLMAQNGAGLTVTEMISVKALLFNNEKTLRLIKTDQSEKIKCVQLFGLEPLDFYNCAKLDALNDFDIFDINMGCPVKKVFSIGQGCALMANASKAAEIVSQLKNAGKTVTVKTRLGIENPDEIFRFAAKIEQAGADMLAVHCRTAKQMYSGQPDYSPIKTLKQQLKIPVAINGDIRDTQSFNLAAKTGADAFLIGRGALYNPFIFLALTKTETKLSKLDMILTLINYMREDFGATRATVEMRKFLPFLLKEHTTRENRHALNFVTDINELINQIAAIFDKQTSNPQ